MCEKKITLKNKSSKKLKTLPTMFEGINDFNSLKKHLETHKNAYNEYMLKKFKEEKQLLENAKQLDLSIEIHHIIPKNSGGADVPWNTVALTIADHNRAHELRYEAYKCEGDALAIRLRSKKSVDSRTVQLERIHLAHANSRKNNTGFFSSEQQAKNGRKGGATKSEKKDLKHFEKMVPIVQEKIQKGLVFSHPDIKGNVCIPSSNTFLLVHLLDVFLEKLPETSKYYGSLKNVNKYSFSSAISKVLKGQRQSYLGFRNLN